MIKKVLKRFLELYFVKLLIFQIMFYKKNLNLQSHLLSYKTLFGDYTQVMEGTVSDHLTSIGSYSYIGRYCYLTKVKIGNYCSIANNVSIGQGEHDLTQISTNSLFYTNAY